MTPEEKALRDAFLAECWRPVRQWRQPRVAGLLAAARNELYAPEPDSVLPAADKAAS